MAKRLFILVEVSPDGVHQERASMEIDHDSPSVIYGGRNGNKLTFTVEFPLKNSNPFDDNAHTPQPFTYTETSKWGKAESAQFLRIQNELGRHGNNLSKMRAEIHESQALAILAQHGIIPEKPFVLTDEIKAVVAQYVQENCRACNGSGIIWSTDWMTEASADKCKVCKGSGVIFKKKDVE